MSRTSSIGVVASAAVTCVVAAVVCRGAGTEDGRTWQVADVLAVPGVRIDEGVKVEVVGVITFRNFRDGLHTVTIQDDTAGVWTEIVAPLSADELAELLVGARVRVGGQVDRGGYAPRIMADEVDLLGEAPLPRPTRADINRLFTGADNGRRVELAGIVQGYRAEEDAWSLVLDVASRRMAVRVPRELLDAEPASLVDAQVECVGVIGSIRNTRGQFLSPILNVSRREDLRVATAAPASAFEAPFLPLPELAMFSPEPLRGRRIRSEGVVTLAYPGRFFYLQEGLHGVRVETAWQEPVAPGDLVDVAGFLDMSRHIGGLVEAVFRFRERGSRPLPVEIQPRDIIAVNERSRRSGMIARPGNYHGCLIQFTATLIEVRPPVGEWCGLTLSDGAFVLTATLPAAEYPRVEPLCGGSSLTITGIADLDIMPDPALALGADPLTQRVGVLVQQAGDVVVVRAPSWWTPARLGIALALALAAAAAALGWSYVLRRQVARAAAALAEQMRSRYQAEAEFQATLRERSRLAANLHDTVLQTVTGIGYQLKGMKASMGRSGPDSSQAVADIDIARRMVDHAVQQLRGTVWAMQSLPLACQSLPLAVESLVQRLRTEHEAAIFLRTKGAEREVSEVVAGNLFLVAQEAVYNALRHAEASRVDVEISFQDSGMVTICVRDDGRGFVPGEQPGAADGHFGIEGMRDRVSRLGGRWSIESVVGAGAVVTAAVPTVGRAAPPSGSAAVPRSEETVC